ncbi:SGNH/GDSL hydrolase family protein [Nonomuraea fastidiosa]|uniref:SGNH/GDSL hydrolase family protein n=1 Tax=Nonomuraea fastidiosa TaxID=46173 RepID=UPI00366EB7B8
MGNPMVNRRHLFGLAGAGGAALATSGLLSAPAHAEAAPAEAAHNRPRRRPAWPEGFVEVQPVSVEGDIAWYDVSHWGVEGKGWSDTKAYFDRLPAKAEGVVTPEVWARSRTSAGILTRFVSDSTTFRARYRLISATTAMYHMPAIGHSGVDLYARAEDGYDAWLANTHPAGQDVDEQMGLAVDPGERLYTAYLPLYNAPQTLQIGVEAGSKFVGVAPRTDPPAVFYGSSIMQGGVASRPGMSITALLGRRFDIPAINLGFSGNARMEPEIAELLTEIEASVYVVDSSPNMNPQQISERAEPFVRILREARPDTPIVLVEDRRYGDGRFVKFRRDRNAQNAAALQAAYRNLRDAGVTGLSYLSADELPEAEELVDGSHPSDLGMMTYANAYERVLHPILARRHH